MSIAVDPRHTDAIGTHLEIGSSEELTSPAALDRLTERLLEHIVVRVTAAERIDPAAIAAIARHLGDPPAYGGEGARVVPGHEIIGDVSARAKVDDGRPRVPSAIESLHQDFGAVVPGLSSHSILYTIDVPPILPMRWVSLSAAYASLPEDVQTRIGPLRAIHSTGPDRRDGARRPLVLRHPRSGRPVLHLPIRRDAAIEGLDDAESAALTRTLWEAIETSPARYEHVLESGDLFIWDNVASVHDNPAFPRAKDREIWFLTIPCETKPVAYQG